LETTHSGEFIIQSRLQAKNRCSRAVVGCWQDVLNRIYCKNGSKKLNIFSYQIFFAIYIGA
jgi:hypothetical protein